MARRAGETREPWKPPTLEERAAERQRLREYLATQHKSEDCPREPEAQFAPPGIWRRAMVLHVNLGGGRHLYQWDYTCDRCKISRRVET